jgi:hypothetical protein
MKFYFSQAFFLIRIPDLKAAIKIDLNLDRQQVPLLLPVVEAVDQISHNHITTYLTKVREILNNLTQDVSQVLLFSSLVEFQSSFA